MEKLYKLTEEDINLIKNEIFHNYKSKIEKKNYEDIIINFLNNFEMKCLENNNKLRCPFGDIYTLENLDNYSGIYGLALSIIQADLSKNFISIENFNLKEYYEMFKTN
jgi:hypothetical protein